MTNETPLYLYSTIIANFLTYYIIFAIHITDTYIFDLNNDILNIIEEYLVYCNIIMEASLQKLIECVVFYFCNFWI